MVLGGILFGSGFFVGVFLDGIMHYRILCIENKESGIEKTKITTENIN